MWCRRICVPVIVVVSLLAGGSGGAALRAGESTLANGIRVVTLDEESPESATFEVWVRAGRWMEPEGRSGLARATAEVLMRAGSEIHGGSDVVMSLCESYQIRTAVETTGEFARIRVWCEDDVAIPFAMGVIAGRLTRPRVGEDDFRAALEELELPSDARFIAEAYARTWGEQHPQSRVESFADLTWDQAVEFYGHYRPANVLIATRAGGEIAPLARRLFEAWQPKLDPPARSTISVSPRPGPSILVIPAAGSPFAVLVRGIDFAAISSRGDLESALAVVDGARGGSGSNLSHSYATMGEICIPIAGDGPLDVQIQRALDTMIATGKSVSAEQLLAAQARKPNGRYEDPLRRAVETAFGRGPGSTEAATPESVREVASRWLDPAKFHLLISGPSELASKVAKYGITVDLASDPEYPKPGDALLAEVVKAFGGADHLASLSTLSWKAEQLVNQGGNAQTAQIRSVVQFPLHMYIEARAPTASRYTTLADGQGWMVIETTPLDTETGSRTVQAMPEGTIADFRQSLMLATTPLMRVHRELRATELSPVSSEGSVYRVLRLERSGVGEVDFFIDPATQQIVRRRDTRVNSRGVRVTHEEALSDYRAVGAFNLPHLRTIYQNGVESVRVITQEFEINPEIVPGTFDAPDEGGTP